MGVLISTYRRNPKLGKVKTLVQTHVASKV